MGCLLPCLLLFAARASGQTVTGSVQGTVVDSSGAVLVGATVMLRNEETGSERVLVTNEVGFYSAPFLSIGSYTIRADLQGFASVIRSRIDVLLNRTTVVNFTLDPRLTAEVTVMGAAVSINATKQEGTNRLTAEQVADEPTLNPGAVLARSE